MTKNLVSATVRTVRRALARAKRGWISRAEAAHFIDVGTIDPRPTDPPHWIAVRDELRPIIEAWRRARWGRRYDKVLFPSDLPTKSVVQ
jgi:hypothetical protein